MRRAFTLVELLTVVVIIGILATMITGAAVVARRYVRKAQIFAEISKLDLAMKAFKEKFGEFPPDGTDQTAVQRAWQGFFPYATEGPPTLNPETALLFWLTGPNGNGFSADPQRPLTGTSTTVIGPFFDSLDHTRVSGAGTSRTYVQPNGVVGQTAPYRYFRAWAGQYSSSYQAGGPVRDTRTNRWVNEKSFQILAPGLNGIYDSTGLFPAACDDMGNFTTGTFEDALE